MYNLLNEFNFCNTSEGRRFESKLLNVIFDSISMIEYVQSSNLDLVYIKL